MVKHTQKIRRQKPTNCLSVFEHFVELALKGLRFSCAANRLGITKNSSQIKQHVQRLPINSAKRFTTSRILGVIAKFHTYYLQCFLDKWIEVLIFPRLFLRYLPRFRIYWPFPQLNCRCFPEATTKKCS